MVVLPPISMLSTSIFFQPNEVILPSSSHVALGISLKLPPSSNAVRRKSTSRLEMLPPSKASLLIAMVLASLVMVITAFS